MENTGSAKYLIYRAGAFIGSGLRKYMCGALLLAAFPGMAIEPTLSQPAGINNGYTSFFDGFPVAPPGHLAYIGYYRYNHINRLTDNNGNRIQAFGSTRIDSWVANNQFLYTFEKSPFDNATLGLDLIVPVVGFDTDFGGPATLKANHGGIGDIMMAVYLQYNPLLNDRGEVTFIHRLELGVNAPTGAYDSHSDINTGMNQWSFHPTWAATWLPVPRWTINWRLQYLYNFKNDDPASSQPLEWRGEKVRHTQIGQLMFLNFATSWEVVPDWHVGINGYYLKQITDDKVNGDTQKNSREQALGIGPGVMWNYSAQDKFTANFYTETEVRNRGRNSAIVNLVYVHTF
ncbi:transporter [Shimwellia blattae]|uniref:Phenol degradation protein meta n=1 Tax=Shimwellia blattae (strain ATCC 29907 / DSM 4481 / JCM 1650 / NBRC 105725 / CDC 9005-74) TaxID=630626 RepID=I2BDV5_SHIBC|nr:transporter [Shimwellia blattae]AFJ48709.1 hypothetical protein EBL_c36580 [Shimwellia blattae DSM 4481 = NBRC 105725]GAB83041.1 hypothetical protein EB105725_41_00060 [Shimwellia blattae DSM 4481 = NBRC 105725]VDY66196.1 Protein involved in meta-pathway of phenol degradation [Shimwellia blattae]VEC27291.1 Protein involved in meta-pathway of phenol degradation [Shimwellia blattae]